MKEGYKVVYESADGRLLSAIARRNPDLVLEYSPSEDTSPRVGYAMVFDKQVNAQNFAYDKTLESERMQVWRCKYEPAPIKLTWLADWYITCNARGFWDAIANVSVGYAESFYGVLVVPAGTRFASTVRLTERVV